MPSNTSSTHLASLASSLDALERGIDGLKRQLKDMEARALELRQEILVAMNGENMKSVNLAGVGRLVVKSRKLYQIQDIELLTRQMLSQIVAAGKAGRPLSDGLLLQKRLHNENFETYLGGADPAAYGVALTEKLDVAFTPEKKER